MANLRVATRIKEQYTGTIAGLWDDIHDGEHSSKPELQRMVRDYKIALSEAGYSVTDPMVMTGGGELELLPGQVETPEPDRVETTTGCDCPHCQEHFAVGA